MGGINNEFWTFDCETYGFKAGRIPKPLLWGAYNGRDYVEFEHTWEFAEFVKARKITAYAHNGGKYDVHFLADHFNEGEKIHVINGRIVKVKMGLAELRDSYSIIPRPLRDYKKDDFDYSVLEPEIWRDHRDYISRYLKNDCVYLHELVSRQRADYGKSLTLAGSAMKVWTQKFDGPTEKQPAWLYKHFQEYYHGGRVQSFFKGIINEPFELHDITSAYPDAMLRDHAAGGTFTSHGEIQPGINPGNYFVKCIGVAKGCFPFRDKMGLNFPDDDVTRTFHISGWEWEAAKDLGLFKGKVIACHVFEEKVNFTPYINHFFKQKDDCKKAGDAAGTLYAKLYLNSLCGKYGSNPEKYKEYILGPECPGEEWELSGELGGHILWERPLPEERQRYYNVCTAASITGFVRAHLLRTIKKTTRVLYCDTDCIIGMGFGGNIGEKIGMWENQGTYISGAFAGKKMYALRKSDGTEKIASKGVKITAEEIFTLAAGGEIEHIKDAPSFSLKGGPRFLKRKIKMT